MKIRLFLPSVALLFSFHTAQAQPTSDSTGAKSFGGVARIHKLSAKSKNLTAEAFYPTFRAQTSLARFASAQLRRETRTGYNLWLAKSRADLKSFPNPPAPFEYVVKPSLLRFRPAKLIALRVDAYQYDGGAHGLGVSLPANFGMANKGPKRLVLGDLFRSGTPYRALVEAKIFAKLRKNPAATWVQDKSVKTLTTAQFNNFEMQKDGLNWIFNPYEMGPFANGQVEVRLSPAELGPDFKSDWLK